MQVTANTKNIRISPQKMKIVADQIKMMKAQEAVKILELTPNKSAKIIRKVILSAIANARNNHQQKEDLLHISRIIVSKGPSFKRYRAIARGRMHPILKRTAHIKVILEAQETKEVPKGPKVSQVTEV